MNNRTKFTATILLVLLIGFVAGVFYERFMGRSDWHYATLASIYSYYESAGQGKGPEAMDELYHSSLSSLFKEGHADWWNDDSKLSRTWVILQIVEKRKAIGLPAFNPEGYFFDGRMQYREHFQEFLDQHDRTSNK